MDISVKSKLIIMQWGIACKGDVNDEKKNLFHGHW